MHSNTRISHGTPNSEARLMITDSFHITLSSAISSPAVTPLTRQIAPSHFPTIPFNSSMPSINMLLPRDTISAISEQPNPIAAACPNSTRKATFPNGTNSVHSHE